MNKLAVAFAIAAVATLNIIIVAGAGLPFTSSCFRSIGQCSRGNRLLPLCTDGEIRPPKYHPVERMASLPTFETERLILRGITEADTPAYEKHFVDYAIISQLDSAIPWPYPQGGVLDWIRTHIVPNQGSELWAWGIVLKAQPAELIGCIELLRQGKPHNRGFWLSQRYWGQGLMTEAVVPVTNYAFDVLGFERLIFANAVGNVGSRRIKEKTGARFLRTEPAQLVNPEYSEREIWELTKEEWIASRGR